MRTQQHVRAISTVALCCAVLLTACGTRASDRDAGDAGATEPDAAPTAAAGGEGASEQDGELFAGRTVAFQVNFSPGGGCDTGARLLIKHLAAHVPGEPQLIVQNAPGAGGLVGLNSLFGNAATDGSTAGWMCGMMPPQALGFDTVRFDARQFHWLGAAYESQVLYAHRDLGVESLADLASATGVVSGGFAPDSTKDLGLQTLFTLLGTGYEHVTGYPGNNDLRVALERGEINVQEETVTGHLTAMQADLDSGVVIPLGQRGIVDAEGEVIRDPRIPEIPTYLELLIEIKGEEVAETVEYRALEALVKADSFLRAALYPPQTEQAYVEAMRAAITATLASDAFNTEATESLGAEPIFVDGAEAQSAAETIVRQLDEDPEARQYLQDLAATAP